MEQLTGIVAINHEGVIGARNALPWRLRKDMQFFREQTMGSVVLMGRKTFDSFGRKCLPGRYNVVVSSQWNVVPEGDACKAASGVEDALYRASRAPRLFRGAFVIGGATIYDQFAPYVDRYLITLVDKKVADADTFFAPPFDEREWTKRILFAHPADSENEASFTVFELRARNASRIDQLRRHAIAAGQPLADSGQAPETKDQANDDFPPPQRAASVMF